MLKTVDVLFLVVVLIAGSATYVVKYGSEIESDKIARLEQQIKVEKEAIDILKANWSLLTNPARIQTLAIRHGDELQLGILKPEQIISIDQLPLKLPVNPGERSAENSADPIGDTITGSVNKEGN